MTSESEQRLIESWSRYWTRLELAYREIESHYRDLEIPRTETRMPNYLAEHIRPMNERLSVLRANPSKGDAQNIGRLRALPLEILLSVVGFLDLVSLSRFTRTCRGAETLVYTYPRLRDLEHLSHAISRLKSHGLLAQHPLHKILGAVLEEACACCSNSNRTSATADGSSPYRKPGIGVYLFTPSLERACEACLRRCPRYCVIQASYAQISFDIEPRGQLRFRTPISHHGWRFCEPPLSFPTFELPEHRHESESLSERGRFRRRSFSLDNSTERQRYYSLRDALEASVEKYGSFDALDARMGARLSPSEQQTLRRKIFDDGEELYMTRDERAYDAWMNVRQKLGGRADGPLHCHANTALPITAGEDVDDDWPVGDYDDRRLTNAGLTLKMPQAPFLKPGERTIEQLYWCWACDFVCAYDDHQDTDVSVYSGGRIRVPEEFERDSTGWLEIMSSQAYRLEDFEQHKLICQATSLFWENRRRMDLFYFDGSGRGFVEQERDNLDFGLAHMTPGGDGEAGMNYTQMATARDVLNWFLSDSLQRVDGPLRAEK